ncbi:trypsin alpha-like [Musca vetustissima]|uniref:trypsin alpha-like n=1 Tax=Musca vetustissima TaxID=27455 RepID=UPI002AB6E8A8|nr:trypsin alpha-like [Musca vetustissima]
MSILIAFQKIFLLGLLVGVGSAKAYVRPTPFFPQSRIVGGATASEGQFPHQVSLRWGGTHVCGGSIISPTYIVTAAHCVTRGSPPEAFPADHISIRAGSRDKTHGGQVIQASQLKIHPDYKRYDNDIALVKLSKPLEFNDKVKAIELATHEPATGIPVITSGWGFTRTGGGSTPKYLQYITLMARRNKDCGPRTPESVLCLAHGSGNGVCSGDSGGPAVYRNQLIGVTNYVVDKCGTTNSDGFASVAYHHNWLISNSRD